ncbi:hypothetical protein [Pseudoxanthomonas wuyuanensis]|uniref:Rhodanese domain-containing protein n=1 Tax=Pseudoxanthomonas wuyuanensis TaxID=1073196 RepID=A0A286CZ07_9GAMM|nr:hypothetical protein [Pseudoxanthomonas wuyuanensis]SOD51609.1 hypothetical protein SAMN06296416_101735 [Pseudoxanthomonas wuyuanensis]
MGIIGAPAIVDKRIYRGSTVGIHEAGARGAGLSVALLFGWATSLMLYPWAAAAQEPGSTGDPSDRSALPLDITPEGVAELLRSGAPFQLVDVDRQREPVALPAEARIIYYSSTPASGHARAAALRNRSERASQSSQRLMGTPVEWNRLKLPLAEPFDLNEPIALSPQILAQALRDGTDLLIVDVRGNAKGPDAVQPFADALALLPNQVATHSATFPKHAWVVVVDDGGIIAPQIARSLNGDGLSLVAYLQGGYVAWQTSADRDIPPGPHRPQP